MQTANHLEAGEGWGGEVSGESWARLQSLLELVREENRRVELSPERREELRERVLARVARMEVQRRRRRALVRAASAVFLAGMILTVFVRSRVS